MRARVFRDERQERLAVQLAGGATRWLRDGWEDVGGTHLGINTVAR